jgi:hypothetical protein
MISHHATGAVIFANLLLSGCAGVTVRPLAGICDQPDPALAMMGAPPQSLREMALSTCLLVGLKIIPKP